MTLRQAVKGRVLIAFFIILMISWHCWIRSPILASANTHFLPLVLLWEALYQCRNKAKGKYDAIPQSQMEAQWWNRETKIGPFSFVPPINGLLRA
jgi:hypothetical protein